MKNYPACSIIILNYYGEKIIERTLDSLVNLNYPKNKYEIIIVDNNSKDRSRKILSSYAGNYRQVKNIFLEENLGFSKGNNIGIKRSKGEFVALINNDCIADRNWLKELVVAAVSDKEVFAVCPKVLLYPKFITIKFYLNIKLAPIYVWLSKSKLCNDSSQLMYLSLWRKPSNSGFEYDYYQIEIPYDPIDDRIIEFTVLFSSGGLKVRDAGNLQDFISFTHKSIKVVNIIKNEEDIECQLSLNVSDSEIKNKTKDKIQNAGIMVFQDGYSRDIGSMVRYSQQFFEYNHGQYNKRREVYGACGAAVLYNKKIIKKLGYLDEHFFMYYEDLDISERARLLGYKIIYEPKAVARHYHALSSKEWSPFFIYHVEKGRLLHIFYNFPFRVFIKEYFYMVYRSFTSFLSILFRLRTLFNKFRTKKTTDREPRFIKKIQIVRALSYFILNSPALILKRLRYMKERSEGIVEENYQKILKGEWYFS